MNVFVVIDTNVVLSTMLTKNATSATVRVMRAMMNNIITPLYNKEILEEYYDVLHRSKFKLQEEDVERMISNIVMRGYEAERVHSLEEIKDPKDVVFYEVALSKEGAYVVTGNIKDFPATPIVVTPAEMVKILEDANLIERL